jgi:cation transport ATPase-like protein
VARPATRIVADTGTDAARGLTRAEAERRLGIFGPNALPMSPRPGRAARRARQLDAVGLPGVLAERRATSTPACDRPSPPREWRPMGCFLALLALISPRLVLIVLAIFSDVLSRAFDSWIIPFLGFFLLPWTTLTYAAFWDWGSGRHVVGFEWFFVALAFLVDLTSYAQGRRARYG